MHVMETSEEKNETFRPFHRDNMGREPGRVRARGQADHLCLYAAGRREEYRPVVEREEETMIHEFEFTRSSAVNGSDRKKS